ncbi:TadE/TadG family type IV pilus assembly protein [Lentzea sp. BCCO 10_0798]|uniref:TadE/TadG family type IV pilus assembly protein n=1 Tax=Lentzea kristufekii TaxID=3095430 RepID=A0ABU4U0Z2_9PSEU|nr:TadE/TadG family type IV pilus assembly protein [Lentzea sp. BCCO 10_0798]MDX8053787.1 TadE/TadG family type IV pilus assembly protein [Lentzea sp. BCCO 10_0798]
MTAARTTPCRRSWWREDRGSASSEIVLVTPLLVMLLVFVAVVVHRGVDARLRINDVAHQAARAASLERTTARAADQARSTATAALASAGVTCRAVAVDIATAGLRPGGSVTVTVSCDVDLGDALMLGAGQKRLSATAIEPVDTYRSGAIVAAGRSGR